MKEEDRHPNAVLKIVKPTLLRAVGTKRARRGTLLVDSGSSLLPSQREKEEVVDVLFWSGGKDSYLSLLLLEQQYLSNKREGRIVLLTTFEGSSPLGEITHQGLCCRDVMNQAKALGLDLLLVPLPDKNGQGVSNISYKDTVVSALKVLQDEISTEVLKFDTTANLKMRLVFGDLHLADIRAWRESTFSGEGGHDCIFPAFNVDYKELQQILWAASGSASTAEVQSIQISAWTGNFEDSSTSSIASKGVTYDEQFVSSLPSNVDPMGEKGEFHTHVIFQQKQKSSQKH